jgi:hypothetical protein
MLAEAGPLPDFTVAYFPDNDFRSHDVGPAGALATIDRVDAALGAMLERAGGLARVLRDTAIVITSDHGHCEVLDDPTRAVVRLDALLSGVVRIGTLGAPWAPDDDVMICPNMRAAQIYFRSPSRQPLARVVARLIDANGVDQVLWREGEGSAGAALRDRRSAAGAMACHSQATRGGTWRPGIAAMLNTERSHEQEQQREPWSVQSRGARAARRESRTNQGQAGVQGLALRKAETRRAPTAAEEDPRQRPLTAFGGDT